MNSNHTYIIAEIGSNHDQSIARAMALIYDAKEAGADAAKFQLYRADSLVERRNAEAYREIYEATEMPAGWLPRLKAYCDEVGIDFMCTAYDEWGVDMVAPYVDLFKVASFELTDYKLLTHIKRVCESAPYDGVVLSTGMGNISDVLNAIHTLGVSNLAYLLHCTSAYPCPIEDVNLNAIHVLQELVYNILYEYTFPPGYGLSDHTTSILTPSIAVGLGARAIEKHLTDDRTRKGPDHHFAIEPHRFKWMVDMVREAEILLGDGVKQPRESENEMMKYRSYSKE